MHHGTVDPGWSGPKAFYAKDFRAPLAPGQTKVWEPIHLWAHPEYYGQETMSISFLADAAFPPPIDYAYTLELLYVPPGMINAPPVGTQWPITDGALTVTVPTYASYDGMGAYQFALRISPIPEPAAGALLALAAGALRRRR